MLLLKCFPLLTQFTECTRDKASPTTKIASLDADLPSQDSNITYHGINIASHGADLPSQDSNIASHGANIVSHGSLMAIHVFKTINLSRNIINCQTFNALNYEQNTNESV